MAFPVASELLCSFFPDACSATTLVAPLSESLLRFAPGTADSRVGGAEEARPPLKRTSLPEASMDGRVEGLRSERKNQDNLEKTIAHLQQQLETQNQL